MEYVQFCKTEVIKLLTDIQNKQNGIQYHFSNISTLSSDTPSSKKVLD